MPLPDHTRLRLRRSSRLAALMLSTCLSGPIEAAQYGVVVNQVSDPLLAGLSIPATAPTAGLFSPVKDWPMNAISLGLLPSGKVVSFGTPSGNPGTQDGRTFDIWDPAVGFGGGHTTLQGVVGVNSFCGTQSFLGDGSLLIAGGIFDNGNDKGSVVLNPNANSLTVLQQKFANDRYYATMITLPDARQLIMGGSYPYLGGYADPQGSIDKGYMTGMTPEVYANGQWSSLFGAKSRDAFGPDNSRWWYPRAWVAPTNKVFGISADKMWMLDASGTGSVSTWAFKQPQRSATSATDAPNVGPTSTAVMYDTGKILQVGGNSYDNTNGFLSSSLATTIDINGATPVVTETAPMKFGRAWAQSTILPTGQVVVSGGSLNNNQDGSSAVLQTETWDPKTGTWTLGASGAVYRGYHSTAILMQNGALLIAGGGAPGPVNNQNVEVYYPPYLFTAANGTTALAPRPQIVSLSTITPNYNQTLQFELSSQNGLAQVVLMGLSQVTHSFNTTQRRYVASFTQSGQGVTVKTPDSAAVLPPGYYQLVAIDMKGVPSPGVIIGFGGFGAPVQTATLVATSSTAANGGGATTGSGGTGTGSAGTGGGTSGNGGTGTAGGTGQGLSTGDLLKAAHSGLCLTVAAGDKTDMGPVTQQACTGAAEQLWRRTSGNGGASYVNAASGKCLDLNLGSLPVNPGVQVFQYACNGGTNQSWKLSAQGGGNALVSAYNNYCISVYGAAMPAGSGIVGWTCNGAADQTFTGLSQPLVAAHSGLCLSVAAGDKTDMGPVTQQACTGAAEQLWRGTAGNGGASYVNVASGKCLDLNLGSLPVNPGVQIFQYACHGGTNQSWRLTAQGAGNALVSAYNNYCISVYGAALPAGSGIVGWTCNGAADQTFSANGSKL